MDERVSRPHERGDPAVRYVTTSSGYVGHRMTGRFRDTAANYAGIWPISTVRWEWLRDDEGFAGFRADREMLPELVMPGDLLGPLTKAASRHTGLPAGLPVFATANDKAVEALGCGLRSRRTLLVSLGTYTTSMTAGGHDVAGGTSFWTNFASVPHEYLYESTGIRRGMWTVSWWRQLLGGDLRRAAGRAGTTVEEYLDGEAAKVAAGSDGLMVVLDWLAPAGAPYRKGSILGFDVRHDRFHVHRAILEGMALTIHRHASAMGDELKARFSEIVVSGGGSNSDLLMQIFADVFGTPARRCDVPDAAGLGAAVCAATGSGLYGSFDEAVAAMVRSGPAFGPDARNHEIYREMSALYAGIPELTDRIYAGSYELFG
jgi:sugar (pentulose or hexulose) kinase